MTNGARGLRQDDLSSIVPQSNLSAILAGKRKISATLAEKFDKFLASIHQFLSLDSKPTLIATQPLSLRLQIKEVTYPSFDNELLRANHVAPSLVISVNKLCLCCGSAWHCIDSVHFEPSQYVRHS